MKETNNFWNFINNDNGTAELLLYGPIQSQKPWWEEEGEGIYPRQFKKDLASMGNVTEIIVRINSGGGDVFAAIAIYTLLKSHTANIVVIIDGIAASAATIVAMAGNTIKAPAPAMVMIHDPLSLLYGYYNSKDLEKMVETLESVKKSILAAYVSKTGKDRDELAALMKDETWWSAEEAKAEGFVDEILFEENIEATMTNDNRFMVVNSIAHDLSHFQARPTFVQTKTQTPFKKPALLPVNNMPKKEELQVKNLAELKEKHPEVYAQVIAEAQEQTKADATETERKRIQAIDEISASIDPALVNKAKFEEPMTAEQLAFQALKQDAAKGGQYLQNRANETHVAARVPANPTADQLAAEAAAVAVTVDTIANGINKKRGGKQ